MLVELFSLTCKKACTQLRATLLGRQHWFKWHLKCGELFGSVALLGACFQKAIPYCCSFSPRCPLQVFHPVECSYCRCESMMGFRYRCQQCHNYQLCQNCFWRGHANGPHSNQHQMKEHSSWVIPLKCLLILPRRMLIVSFFPPSRCLCVGHSAVHGHDGEGGWSTALAEFF